MKTQNRHDEFIRKLVQQQEIEKAPDHFTEKLMEKIKASPGLEDTPLLSTGTWIAIIAGLAAMIVIIFTVDMPLVDNFFSSSNIEKVSMNIFSKGFFSSLSSFFQGFKFSSISVGIVAAAAGLILIERILRKRFTATNLLVI